MKIVLKNIFLRHLFMVFITSLMLESSCWTCKEKRILKKKCFNNLNLSYRMFWVFVLILSTIATIWIVTTSYKAFLDGPTATSQLPTRVPVSSIPFPAVGICSGNRISKSAAMLYADYM